MKVLFISAQYRSDTIHGIVENIRKAEEVAKIFWKKGYAVICPHKNSSLLDGIVADTAFLEADLEILGRCDACVMVEGWSNSIGANAEYNFCIENGIRVIHPSEYDRE